MRKRKPRKPNEQFTVRAHITIGARDHAIWSACAALAGMDRGAFAVEAIKAACSGLILIDKRTDKQKPAGPVKIQGSADLASPVDPDAGDAA